MGRKDREVKTALLITVAIWGLLQPAAAKACSGWIDCWLGISSTTEIRQTQMTERQQIEAQRDQEIARIQAQQAERERMADAEIERIKQQQFATEAERDMAIAREQARVAEYKASIQAIVDKEVAGIMAVSSTQIAALQEQSKIAIEGITQTGQTERYRIVGGWAFAIVIAIILGIVFVRFSQRQRDWLMLSQMEQQQRLGMHWNQIQQNSDAVEIVMVKNGKIQRY